MPEVTDPSILKAFGAQRGPVLGPPKLRDPYKERDQQLQEESNARGERSEARQEGNDAFQQARGLRKDFEGLPEVSRYKTIIGSYAGSLGAQDTAEGDQLLINSYAQMLNPTSTVMLGEYQATEQNQAAIDRTISTIKRELKLDGAGRLVPESRQRIYREMQNLAKRANQAYSARRREFGELASRYGFDESEIIGSHAGAPYEKQIQDYWDSTRTPQSDASDLPPDIDPNDVKTIIRGQNGEIVGYEPTDGGPDVILFETQSDDERNTVMGAIDAGVRGVADTVTLGMADEIAAAGDTIFSGGTMKQNLARQRGVDRQDERVNPIARISGQVAGGFALPGAGVRSIRGITGLGAGYGGGYGFGSGEGSITDRLVSAGKGAAVGAAVGGTIGTVANRLIPRGGGDPTGGNADVAAAAQRLRLDVLPADVGGPVVQRITAGMAQTPFGGAPIIKRAQALNEGAGARLAAIAQSEGAPLRQETFGDTVRAAAEGYGKRSGETGGKLYDRAKALSGDVWIEGKQARANITAQIKELSETPNTSGDLIAGLKKLGADIPKGKKLSIDAIRRLRTNVRSEAQSETLRKTDYQRRAGLVLDDLSKDIAAELPKEAAEAFLEADDFWKQRLNNIDDVMAEVIGPKGDRSAESVSKRLVSMSRGDSARLRTFVNTLKPEEAGIVRGSLIQEMGRAKPGQQGADGTKFSLETFLTNWAEMPERTKALLFRGESRSALDDLATVAEGARASKRFANTSNTGGAGNVISMLGGLSSLGASIPIEYVTGRLLASPRFTRLLLAKPDKAKAAKSLSRIAAREPALAPDIAPILNAIQLGPQRLAAEESPQ